MPELLTEAEADRRFQLRARLASGGDYGCAVLLIDAQDEAIAPRPGWMGDAHFRAPVTAADSSIQRRDVKKEGVGDGSSSQG